MYQFTINNLTVNTTAGTEEIIPKKINIIVGPNNSGKSKFLKEIRDYLSGDISKNNIISKMDFSLPNSFSELNRAYSIESKMVKGRHDTWYLNSYTNRASQVFDLNLPLEQYLSRQQNGYPENWKTDFEHYVKNSSHDPTNFLRTFGSIFFQYLGTEERLMICKTQRNYALDSGTNDLLSSIKYDNVLLKKLNIKVKEIFKKEIYLDTQTLGEHLTFRVGDDFKYYRKSNNPTKKNAKKLFSEKTLDDEGDGLKSFVSSFIELHTGINNILLLDEPEAFLHPPLARKMGEMIGAYANKNKTVFIATHSVEVLKGILSTSHDINVIRITRPIQNKNEIKICDRSVLSKILNNSLLRTSRVLEGIFCEKVIITESESDELIFQELATKIFPTTSSFFVHAQNKQTISKIAEMYKKIKVDYEIIVDFDLLNDLEELKRFINPLALEKKAKTKIVNLTKEFKEILAKECNGKDHVETKDFKKNVFHKKGILHFDNNMQKRILNAIKEMDKFHLHIIETGELETIFEKYGLPHEKTQKWLCNALDKISKLEKKDIKQRSTIYRLLKYIK